MKEGSIQLQEGDVKSHAGIVAIDNATGVRQ